MIHVTFPDGARRAFEPGLSGLDIAKCISPSLAKRTVAMIRDGELVDLADRVDEDASLEFIARDDPRALELIRHDAAHVLADAVQSLWPDTQVTIGPVIENGFYYDFFRSEPFTPEDFPAIEKRMREIIARDEPFVKTVVPREEAKSFFETKGEAFKVELIDSIPPGEDLKLYSQGGWTDLCRGPHMTSTGKIGDAFKLMKVGGGLLARRFHQTHAIAHLRHGLRQKGRARRLPEADRGGRAARPSQARPRDGPLPFPGGGAGLDLLAPEGLGDLPDPHRLHAPPPGRRLSGGQRAAGAR